MNNSRNVSMILIVLWVSVIAVCALTITARLAPIVQATLSFSTLG